jgi:thiosulfate reductase cytochrome b subunit
MSQAVLDGGATKLRGGKTFIRRHRLVVRICHWINVVALTVMLMSGLSIFNAHPALYWGKKSTFDAPWLFMQAEDKKGYLSVGGAQIETTGVLGYSKAGGVWQQRGFPAWATLPWYQSLAEGRNWHLFFAWIFVINGLVYLITGLINRHLLKDLLPTPKDLAHVPKDIGDHLRLKFPKGKEAARYQVLQRIAYSGMVFVVLPLIVLTGLCMSPGFDSTAHWLVDLFGGRQSARSIHFLCMAATVVFIVVHLVMVVLSGPINQIRGMITGRYAIEDEGDA